MHEIAPDAWTSAGVLFVGLNHGGQKFTNDLVAASGYLHTGMQRENFQEICLAAAHLNASAEAAQSYALPPDENHRQLWVSLLQQSLRCANAVNLAARENNGNSNLWHWVGDECSKGTDIALRLGAHIRHVEHAALKRGPVASPSTSVVEETLQSEAHDASVSSPSALESPDSSALESNIFCSSCGNQIEVSSKFCKYCGHKVS
jgi:hypothetical protein